MYEPQPPAAITSALVMAGTTDGNRVVWDLLIENAATVYRATPLSDIKGEVEIPD